MFMQDPNAATNVSSHSNSSQVRTAQPLSKSRKQIPELERALLNRSHDSALRPDNNSDAALKGNVWLSWLYWLIQSGKADSIRRPHMAVSKSAPSDNFVVSSPFSSLLSSRMAPALVDGAQLSEQNSGPLANAEEPSTGRSLDTMNSSVPFHLFFSPWEAFLIVLST